VDPQSIIEAKHGHHVWKDPWTKDELFERVLCAMKTKDAKTLKGGPYREVVLIIYSDDDRALTFDLLADLKDRQFPPCAIMTRIFFLASYDPHIGSCVAIELRLAAQKGA
jgi:hypothetical protein